MWISIALLFILISIITYFAEDLDDILFDYYHKDDPPVRYTIDEVFNSDYEYGFLELLLDPFVTLHMRISHAWFRIRMFLQRVFRGWSDEEIWGLSGHAASYILKRLIVFKERYGRNSLPMHYSENRELTQEEWDEILDEMIYYLLCVEGTITIDNKRYRNAARLFARYFHCLVD